MVHPYFVAEAVTLTSTFAVLTVIAGLLIFSSSANVDKLGFIHRPMHIAVLVISFSFTILSVDSQGALGIWPWPVRFFPWLIVFNTGFVALSHYLFGTIFVLNESTGRCSPLANWILGNQKVFLRTSGFIYGVISLTCDIIAILTDHGMFRGIWVALCGVFWLVIVVFLILVLKELNKRIERVSGGSASGSHDNSYRRNYRRLVYTTVVSIVFSLYLMFLGLSSIRNNLSVAHQPPLNNFVPAPYLGLITGAILMIYVVRISWIPVCGAADQRVGENSRGKAGGPAGSTNIEGRKMSKPFAGFEPNANNTKTTSTHYADKNDAQEVPVIVQPVAISS
jgi:hypothetical protein